MFCIPGFLFRNPLFSFSVRFFFFQIFSSEKRKVRKACLTQFGGWRWFPVSLGRIVSTQCHAMSGHWHQLPDSAFELGASAFLLSGHFLRGV